MAWSIHGRLTPKPDQAVRHALAAFWTTIVRRIPVEHLLDPLRINFDLEATAFELEQRG